MTAETPTTPKTRVVPLSLAACGTLNVLIYNHITTKEDGTEETATYATVKRVGGTDLHAIPLMEVPALATLLDEVAKGMTNIRTYAQAPVPENKPPKKKDKAPKKSTRPAKRRKAL